MLVSKFAQIKRMIWKPIINIVYMLRSEKLGFKFNLDVLGVVGSTSYS